MRRAIIIALMGFLGFSLSAHAQQADRIQRGQRGYVPPSKITYEAYIEIKEPQVEVERMLPRLVVEFNLDAFEQEIIKGIIINKVEKENKVLEDKANTREDRKQKLMILEKEYYKELSTILSGEEVEILKTMNFESAKEVKKQKRKNKKKNKN